MQLNFHPRKQVNPLMTQEQEQQLSQTMIAMMQSGGDAPKSTVEVPVYAWRLIRWEADVPLTEEQRQEALAIVPEAMALCGVSAACFAADGDVMTVLLALTRFPARAHRDPVLWLLGKSNPSLIEWLYSPVVYAQTAAWRHFADCADAYFSVERNLHHQYASAHSTWRNFLQGEQVRLKKYLYALRPLLCFRYVEQYGNVAPVPFDKLCAAVLPDSMRGVVDDLLAQKKQAREKETAPRIPELDAYLLAEFAHAEQVLEALPNPAAPDLGRLNVVFQTMLAETSDDFQNFPNSDE